MIDPNEIKYSLQPKNEIWQAVFYVNGKYYWRSTKVRVPNMNPSSNLYKKAKNEATAMIPILRDQLIHKLEKRNGQHYRKPNKINYNFTQNSLIMQQGDPLWK